jgi:hypothetical protein
LNGELQRCAVIQVDDIKEGGRNSVQKCLLTTKRYRSA